ncbi:lactate dehydrogenase [Demequina capsici]|uniref:Lactate dehydrogenase n=1 Tax=Demequina capsici TaxID=3075620 RepID=A0AA96FBR2_9MICO|nr:lactate dehydrogenase [Demequina sp. PMTSA13]WNM26824.1 lactate dehydrogenase [Demequina sp. PMTSA13]
MDVAIIGATGDVGRAVCSDLIEHGELGAGSRLQLVGRAGGSSEAAVHGLRVDLIDAYDEKAPHIDVATSPDDVVADVVVVAAGRTIPTGTGQTIDRDRLAADNRIVFEQYADSLARHGSGHEVVIVVSNPVELAVEVFARRLGHHRVIGMGAWLDTLRFRREIAATLGIRRQRVSGFVAGQHGDRMVPLWSTVRLRGLDADERLEIVERLRGDRTLASFASEIATAKAHVTTQTDMAAAFGMVDAFPPDLQAVIRPYLTHTSGAKTANGTASATVDLIRTVLDGRDIVVAGQVLLDGEIELGGMPWRGVLGVPVAVGPEGWTRVMLDDLAPDESRLLWEVGQAINEAIVAWGGGR